MLYCVPIVRMHAALLLSPKVWKKVLRMSGNLARLTLRNATDSTYIQTIFQNLQDLLLPACGLYSAVKTL